MSKNTRNRILLTAVAALLLVAVAVGGTMAWLQDKTQQITNTFTPSNLDIELTETTGKEYKMVPGNTINKDPKVTVKANSEALWLFVKIEKNELYGTYLADYTVAEGWQALTGQNGVYYREVAASTIDQEFYVLAGGTDDHGAVTVLTSVTNAQMAEITGTDAEQPTLSFTAYAVQKDNFADAATAWTTAKDSAVYPAN